MGSFPTLRSTRPYYAGLLLFCSWLLAASLGLQVFYHLEPCSLCIVDRLIVMVLWVLAFLGIIIAPLSGWHRLMMVVGLLLSAAGISSSAWHLWLLHFPPEHSSSCGPNLNYLVQTLPFKEAIAALLKGSADCAHRKTVILGLTLPAWTLLSFCGLMLTFWLGFDFGKTKKKGSLGHPI